MSSNSEKKRPPTSIGGGRFDIDKKLGAGCFGEVWRGHDTSTKDQVAVKFEDIASNASQLEHEADVLRYLAKPSRPQGFAEVFHFGTEGQYRCLVMECLGRSLEERMVGEKGKFSVGTTALVAEQVLRRIEYLHSRGVVHRDIKPENFMFGVKDKIHHLYLIDFGLSKRYFEQKHVTMRAKLSLTGTARYASINAHKGMEQSRRDDLEAIGHMLAYFLRGALPWSGLDARTQEEKYRKIREKKEDTKLDDLLDGYPDAFKIYLKAARELDFKDRPNYIAYRKLFRDLRTGSEHGGPLEDHQFQWFEGKFKDNGPLVPLVVDDTLRQPDDAPPQAKRGGFCLCGNSKVRD